MLPKRASTATCLIIGRYATCKIKLSSTSKPAAALTPSPPTGGAANLTRPLLMLPTRGIALPPPCRCLCSRNANNSNKNNNNNDSGDHSCWKCSKPSGGGLFCSACGTIQSPDSGTSSINYYQLLFGPSAKPTYRLDLAKLATAMRQLQWLLHPDKFSGSTEEERILSQQQSARVNSAYRCLTDPVNRAVYLLSLRGVAMPTEETSGSSGDLSLPQEFLAEMLELNEALMEADRSTVGSIAERVDADTALLTDELTRAFDEANNLELAKELTYRLRYFANIRAKIKELA